MKKFFTYLTAACAGVCAVLAGYMFIQRFMHLQMGFLYDELYSMATASPRHPFGFLWKEILLKDVNPPLYNILLYGWNQIFPATPFFMRLFSALASAATVPLAYLLAPAAWPRLKKFMLLTLTACSSTLAVFSINIRTYALAALTVYAFTLLALRIIDALAQRQAPSKTVWVCFFTAGLAGAYLHFFSAGLFFIAALVTFLYACRYKTGRAVSFWGTAAVFALWTPWLFNTFLITQNPQNVWWYSVPVARATWEILQYILGEPPVLAGLLVFGLLAAVSLIRTYKTELFKQADLILPLAQVVLLCLVVAVVSLRFNLWIDRYFVLTLPPILILLAGLLFHLQQRHKILIILLPTLLIPWVKHYYALDFRYVQEFTGLKDAFAFISGTLKADKVFIDMDKTGYPQAALDIMFAYYLPPNGGLRFIPLTRETAPLAVKEPKSPVLLPLCTQIHLINASLAYGIEEDREPYVFGNDICVMTVHSVPPEQRP